MGTLSLALPFSAFLYLLPSVPNLSPDLEKAIVNDQLNDIGIIDAPKELRKNNGKIELENDGFLYPLGIIKPVINSVNDATKLNVDFQAKVESKKHPDHTGISTNVQLAKQAQWSHDVSLDEFKKFLLEKERIKNLMGAFKYGNRRGANVLQLRVPDIADTSIDKFAKMNIQLGSNLLPRDRNKVDNRPKEKYNYIRLCRKSIGGSTTSLMQKLRGKDCVKLPRSEFYLEQDSKYINRKEGMFGLAELNIETKSNDEKNYRNAENESDEYKRQNGSTDASLAEASISDDSTNYEEPSPINLADKFGMTLNIKKPVIDGKIGKLALSATTLKV